MEEILTIFNPWWKSGGVKTELAPEFRRELFTEIVKGLDTRQVKALYGLRRTGKSTILFQAMQELMRRGVAPERVLYFSFDERAAVIKDIFSTYARLHGLDLEKGKYYIFFDEIQKLEDWQNKLKVFYDMYPNMRFFVSGSSYLGLSKRGAESLGGRMQFLKLEPLSFKEWLAMNGVSAEKPSLRKDELRAQFDWYMKTPFPEIAAEREDIRIRKYIDELIVSRIISFDIKKEYPDADVELLETLKDIFFGEIGFMLNMDDLAKDLHRGKEVLQRHIGYLVQGLILRAVRNYRGSERSSSRKLKRIYPYHPCFCLGAGSGKYIEGLFVSLLDARFYWRDASKEVDIVKGGIPVEVKYREAVQKGDLVGITAFMKEFGRKAGYVITKDSAGTMAGIELVPAWRFALEPPTGAFPNH